MSIGLPPLVKSAGNVLNNVVLLASDARLVLQLFSQSQWGIYLNNKRVLTPDSIAAMNFRNDSNITNAPQEQGAFQSYNKVKTPFQMRVRMTKGGTVGQRSQFLTDVSSLSDTLDLYQIATPEVTYSNVNITHFDYSREASRGYGLITVDVWFEQIRISGQTQFSNSKDANGAARSNTGTVQPQTATSKQVAAGQGAQ